MDEFAVPIMPANDLDATLSFYERLGFKNAGSAPTEWNYLIIRRGSVQLHFYGDPQVDPLTTSSSCYVYTEDADALYDEWGAIGVARPAQARASRPSSSRGRRLRVRPRRPQRLTAHGRVLLTAT